MPSSKPGPYGWGVILIAHLGGLLSASMFFIPIMLQQVCGHTPIESGAAMLPLVLLLGIAPLSAGLLRRASDRGPPVLVLALAGCGLLWLGRMPAVLVGAGIGLAMMSGTQPLMDSVASDDSGLASGLHNSARQLGGANGIAGPDQSVSAARLLGFHAAFTTAGIASFVLAGMAMPLTHQARRLTGDGLGQRNCRIRPPCVRASNTCVAAG